jgi:hypothetical protein
LFVFTSAGLGATSAYQTTKDGKTTVWNGTPRSGEIADWEGDRDREGYASGFGSLTWFNPQGATYARYYGNMIKGKFDGPVNLYSNGEVAHAFFVDGGRVTGWARGAAPSRMAVPEGVRALREKAARSAVLSPGEVRPIEHIAEKPEPTIKRAKAIKAENVQPVTAPSAQPSKKQVMLIEPTPLPALTGSPPEVTETPNAQGPNAKEERPMPEASAETSPPTAVETPRASATAPKIPVPTPTPKHTVDDSLRSLVAPPSSLRSRPLPEGSAPLPTPP